MPEGLVVRVERDRRHDGCGHGHSGIDVVIVTMSAKDHQNLTASDSLDDRDRIVGCIYDDNALVVSKEKEVMEV